MSLEAIMNADSAAFLASQGAVLQSAPAAEPPSVPNPAQASPAVDPTPAAAVSGQPPAETSEAPAGAADEDFGEFNPDVEKDPEPAAENAAASPTPVPELSKEELDGEFGKFLALPRGKLIYSGHQTMQQLAKPDEEGGIGHRPSVDQIREYFGAYVDVNQVNAEFRSNTPDGMARWANRWFPSNDPQGSAQAAHRMMSVLPEQNPAAYQAARQVFTQREGVPAVRSLIEQSRTQQDEATAEKYYIAAQELHKTLFGQYFDPALAANQPQPQGNRPHPAEIELQRIRQEQAQQQQQAASQSASVITQEINSAMETDLNALADQALQPIRDRVSSVIYRGLKNDYLGRVKDAIGKNQQMQALLDSAKTSIIRSQNRQEIPNLRRTYRQMAAEPLKQFRAEYLREAGVAAKAHSDARHAELQQAASRTEPQASTASPAQRNLAPALERKPRETREQYIGRMIDQDFASVR